MGVRMWLDDIRDPARHGCIGWVWIKTYDDAVALLATGQVVEASLDHDLTIQQTIGNPDGERTGYDVVCWMEEHNVWPPMGVTVHSLNPSGKARMEAAIRRAYRAAPAAQEQP